MLLYSIILLSLLLIHFSLCRYQCTIYFYTHEAVTKPIQRKNLLCSNLKNQNFATFELSNMCKPLLIKSICETYTCIELFLLLFDM